MARILALSSRVASGHVGLSAIEPALQRLGHEVIGLPTILLSNHPGRQRASGMRIDPAVLEQMLETLEANGRLDDVDAVLTGYLPSAAHVGVATAAIERCRAKAKPVVVLCDPVLGDDPKGLYIDPAAAAAIRSELLPRADIVTPNRFELAWLTGSTVTGPGDAITAARSLPVRHVVATSIVYSDQQLATILVTAKNTEVATVQRRETAANGTGDLLSALFLAGLLQTPGRYARALHDAVNAVDDVLTASADAGELCLVASQMIWSRRFEVTT